MDDSQLIPLVDAGLALSERLALESRFVDAAAVTGLVQTVRALRTKLEPVGVADLDGPDEGHDDASERICPTPWQPRVAVDPPNGEPTP